MSVVNHLFPSHNKNTARPTIPEMDAPSFFSALAAANPSLPMPSSMPSAKKAQNKASSLSKDLFAEWTTLEAILERHEAVIRRRWLKKSRDQRKRILLKAWPNMAAHHRPDFEAYCKGGLAQSGSGFQLRNAYMFPHINLEDLSEGKNLPLLLNSRGRHHPEAFATADLRSGRLGFITGIVTPAFINETTMLLYGQTTPETYGKIINWDDDDRAFDWMISGAQPQPGEGLQILEIQQRVLAFLTQCCRLILSDMAPESLTSPDVAVQPEPEPIVTDPSARPSLFATLSEAPYRLPSNFDFQRLHLLVAAKLDSCSDHLWALREDPGYFAEAVGDLSQHRMEHLRDSHGFEHPELDQPVFWDRVLAQIVKVAHGLWMFWERLLHLVQSLLDLDAKYGDDLDQNSIPDDYSDALHQLKAWLDMFAEVNFKALNDTIAGSPQTRHMWEREPPTSGSIMMKARTKAGASRNRLLWLISLLINADMRSKVGVPSLMDELERTMQRDPTQAQLVSPLVAGIVSDASLVSEGLRQLELHPWARTQDHESIDKEEALQEACFQTVNEVDKFTSGLMILKLSERGDPSNRFFYYPIDKKRTQSRVEELRRAEQRLDAFWAPIDRQAKQFPRLRHIWETVSKGRSVQRTPEWVQPPSTSAAEATEQQLHEPFDHLRIGGGLQDQIQDSVVSTTPKTKVKTRGIPHSELTGEIEDAVRQPPLEEPEGTVPQFEVGKRAFKVFSTLFSQASHASQAGEIPWADFLHALGSVGLIPEKLYGSVWQFTPVAGAVSRAIQIHEPHPRGKIPFWSARQIGRRLNRNFGWTGQSFTEK